MTSRITETGRGPERRGAAALLRAEAVRASARRMLHAAQRGDLADWAIDMDRLRPTARLVAEVTRRRYPDLKIPVHSRWRHFVFRDADLWEQIAKRARWTTAAARARSAIDLVIASVLLDAGAGAEWSYHDAATGQQAMRSEGLALASVRWFESGGLSSDPDDPYRVDAQALLRIATPDIETAFQSRDGNRLVGTPGRCALLQRLGRALEARPDLFATTDAPRLGGLFDVIQARAARGRIAAGAVLELLLEAFGSVWQGRPSLEGRPLGDCWPHPELRGPASEDGYVALHKLSQWLAYSLIEPLATAGITVSDVDTLTGLAEYRNGGLFVDMAVLLPRDPGALAKSHAVAEPFVVGWRALTVALLDALLPLVAEELGLAAQQLPLASMLEGGTWAAGRVIAGRMRSDGGPPFHIQSDGTVF